PTISFFWQTTFIIYLLRKCIIDRGLKFTKRKNDSKIIGIPIIYSISLVNYSLIVIVIGKSVNGAKIKCDFSLHG
ncbi:MAG: hypothetical protein ABI288_00765, partial [Ginsengibacter sp.]